MRELQKGDAVVSGFWCNLCRPYRYYKNSFYRRASEQLKDIITFIKSQLTALDKAAEGMTEKNWTIMHVVLYMGQAARNAWAWFRPVGQRFMKLPSVSPRGEEALKKGMAFTIEPVSMLKTLASSNRDNVTLTSEGLRISQSQQRS